MLRHVKEEALIAPFSGHEARVGDAVFRTGKLLILIEIKRSRFELDSEQSKFATGKYEEAHAAI